MKASRKQMSLLRSLRTRKGRRETGLFLVEGAWTCDYLARCGVSLDYAVHFVLVSAGQREDERIAKLTKQFEQAGVPVVHAPAREVHRISDTVHGQGIVAAARWSDVPFDHVIFQGPAVVLALDRVSDPGNVGTVIRTAAWFGASAVLLGKGCADLLNPKTVRATMGAIFSMLICRDVSLADALDRLSTKRFSITVAAPEGEPEWRRWAEPPKSLLVLGSEAHGVDAALRAKADHVAAIPRVGQGESLNVAVTAGIFLSAVV